MGKITGPALSISASGSIAKTMVYSKWKGRGYVRQHVIPANPRTSAQTAVRDVFKWLNQVWLFAPAAFQDIYNLYVVGQVMTPRNGLIKQNVPMLQVATDLSDFVFSPGAKGGLPPASATFTGGSGEVTVAITAPTPPDGWTVAAAIGFAIKAQDPHSGTAWAIYTAQDVSSPYSAVITVPAGDYQCGAVIKWTKSNGDPAYGTAITGTATAT